MADLNQEVERGREAERIIRNPLWDEAFRTYQDRLLSAWKSSSAKECENRERLWLAYQLSEKVRTHLESVFRTGQMASIQIEDLHERTR